MSTRARDGGNALEIVDKVNDTNGAVKTDSLVKQKLTYGDLLVGSLANILPPASPTQEVRLFFDWELDTLCIAVRWSR